MPHYPHMLYEDTVVWSKFLELEDFPIERVWYDVRVGSAVDVGPGSDELVRRISRGITRKRIDVVAKVGGVFWVIEIKPYGNFVALGQVISYRRLFDSEYGRGKQVLGVLVCETLDPDLRDDFQDAGVRVYEVAD